MIVMHGEGPNAIINDSMIAFQNPSCSYFIRDLPDSVQSVGIRTEKNSLMDQKVFAEWFSRNRLFKRPENWE